MAFIFDHLIAFIVGASLLVALLFVQQRGGQQAVEATVRYRTEVQAASFAETLTRDLENLRTREQAAAALGTYATDEFDKSMGGTERRALAVHGTAARTDFIQFVTLEDPAADTDGDPKTRSGLVAVAYRMEPTGQQVTARGRVRALHRVVRYVYAGGRWEAQGGSPPTVVGFQVAAMPGGPNVRITNAAPRIDVALEFANEVPDRQAGDQQERAEVGLTRQGATVRVYAAGTGDRSLPPNQGSGLIPRLPWVGPPPPPPPPPVGGPGGTTTASTGGAPTTNTGGNTSGSNGGGGNSWPKMAPIPGGSGL